MYKVLFLHILCHGQQPNLTIILDAYKLLEHTLAMGAASSTSGAGFHIWPTLHQ